jgi:hypothetical protein
MKDAAEMERWAARDFVFNLEAIPADRLDWKPSPEAKSALQLAGEVAGVAGDTLPVLQGGHWIPPPLPHPPFRRRESWCWNGPTLMPLRSRPPIRPPCAVTSSCRSVGSEPSALSSFR